MNNQVRVYPNPTKGNLILDSQTTIKSIKIYMLDSGQFVESFKGSIHLDLSHFEPGTYTLEMKLKGGLIERSNVIVE